jgi:hypothetical protein
MRIRPEHEPVQAREESIPAMTDRITREYLFIRYQLFVLLYF